jgi:phosphosulfolactate synthase (CoM biosynthesis protein A)
MAMTATSMTHEPAFDFPARPARTMKPRERGLTVVSDKTVTPME